MVATCMPNTLTSPIQVLLPNVILNATSVAFISAFLVAFCHFGLPYIVGCKAMEANMHSCLDVWTPHTPHHRPNSVTVADVQDGARDW